MVLQGVLSLVLALVFVRYRPQLEQVEHWRFVAKRPIAAGLLVGVLSGLVFYEQSSGHGTPGPGCAGWDCLCAAAGRPGGRGLAPAVCVRAADPFHS